MSAGVFTTLLHDSCRGMRGMAATGRSFASDAMAWMYSSRMVSQTRFLCGTSLNR